MELKIKVNIITIKDENSSQVYTIKTVRTAGEIYEDLADQEKEALANKVYELGGQY